jgi:antitoxin ParD1/3/4
METVNFSLPEDLKRWVETQVASGGYGNTSEYIRELIRAERKRKAEERLEALLIEGLDSGDPIEITPEYWERKRRELVARVEEMRKQKKRA